MIENIIFTVVGGIFGLILSIVWNKFHQRTKIKVWIYTTCLKEVSNIENPDIYIAVHNNGNKTIQNVNAHIMDSEWLNIKLKTSGEKTERFEPDEIKHFKLEIFKIKKNSLTKNAEELLLANPEKIKLRIFKQNSREGLVYESSEIGKEILNKIRLFKKTNFKMEVLGKNEKIGALELLDLIEKKNKNNG